MKFYKEAGQALLCMFENVPCIFSKKKTLALWESRNESVEMSIFNYLMYYIHTYELHIQPFINITYVTLCYQSFLVKLFSFLSRSASGVFVCHGHVYLYAYTHTF